jgi:hypothetical protein
MAEVKNKVVTVESLAAVNTHNQETYMTKSDPTGVGTMTMTGGGNFSGVVEVSSLKLGDATLEYDSTDGVLKIVFSE